MADDNLHLHSAIQAAYEALRSRLWIGRAALIHPLGEPLPSLPEGIVLLTRVVSNDGSCIHFVEGDYLPLWKMGMDIRCYASMDDMLAVIQHYKEMDEAKT